MSLLKGVSQLLDYTFNSLDVSSGTSDILVVRHPDGSLHSSPFNVRFGLLKAPRSREKIVRVEVNGALAPDTYLKIGDGGVAYWLIPKPTGRDVPSALLSSPLPSPKDNRSNDAPGVSPCFSPPSGDENSPPDAVPSSISAPTAGGTWEGIPDGIPDRAAGVPLQGDAAIVTNEILDREDASLALEHRLVHIHEHLVAANRGLLDGDTSEAAGGDPKPLRLCAETNAWDAQASCMRAHATPSQGPSVEGDDVVYEDDDDDDEDYELMDVAAGGDDSSAWMISVTPLSQQLEQLKLVPGKNTLRFILHNNLLGTRAVTAYAYLFRANQKLVISDVDGTITRSDVLGHILPRIGKDWTHDGLCDFYNSIARNGYQLVYLTARSISQAESTRNFLNSIEQNGVRLPDGPLLCAPDRIFTAFTREVITKTPHEFKIACLNSIRKAFPSQAHPFYAGLGNRVGDVIAYTAVGIPTHKVLIIDKRSTVYICKTSTSYSSLAQLVNEGFPPNREVVKWEEFNSMYYWNTAPMAYFQPPASSTATSTGKKAPNFTGRHHACFLQLGKHYVIRHVRSNWILTVENGSGENKTWVKLVPPPGGIKSAPTSQSTMHLWKFEAVSPAVGSTHSTASHIASRDDESKRTSAIPPMGTASSASQSGGNLQRVPSQQGSSHNSSACSSQSSLISDCTTGGTSSSRPPPTAEQHKPYEGNVCYYVLRNVHTNKILNVSKGGIEHGNRVWLHRNVDSPHSHFSLTVVSRPLQQVRIVNRNSTRCLSAEPLANGDEEYDVIGSNRLAYPALSSVLAHHSPTVAKVLTVGHAISGLVNNSSSHSQLQSSQASHSHGAVPSALAASTNVPGSGGSTSTHGVGNTVASSHTMKSASQFVCQTVRDSEASSDDTSINWILQLVEEEDPTMSASNSSSTHENVSLQQPTTEVAGSSRPLSFSELGTARTAPPRIVIDGNSTMM